MTMEKIVSHQDQKMSQKKSLALGKGLGLFLNNLF